MLTQGQTYARSHKVALESATVAFYMYTMYKNIILNFYSVADMNFFCGLFMKVVYKSVYNYECIRITRED